MEKTARKLYCRWIGGEQLERRDVLASIVFDLFPVSVPKPDGVADVAVGDMDNDGDQDVVSVATRGGELLFHENANGEGAFFASRKIASGIDRPTSALIADFDLDNDLDVVLAARGAQMLVWFENDGRGVFSDAQSLMASENRLEGAASMSLADLDGDGDQDVAVATLDSFIWLENLADGNFSEPRRIARSIMLPSGVSTADLDGDGDADVVATTALDSRTMWYENTGDGTFMARHVISRDTKFVTAVKTKDIDADGDLDVLTTSFLDGAIVWHENSSGRFLKSTQIGQMDGISDLAVFDMDGDQDLDMVASTSTVDRVVWFENTNGQANFSEGRTIQSNIRNVRAIDSTDIDGDGLADIVLASYAHDVVAWFRQTPQSDQAVGRSLDAFFGDDLTAGPGSKSLKKVDANTHVDAATGISSDRALSDVDSKQQILNSQATDAIFTLPNMNNSQTNKLQRYRRRSPVRIELPVVETAELKNETIIDDSVMETD